MKEKESKLSKATGSKLHFNAHAVSMVELHFITESEEGAVTTDRYIYMSERHSVGEFSIRIGRKVLTDFL